MSIIHTWNFQNSASDTLIRFSPNASPYRGLDPSLMEAFPTFLYASVKDLRNENSKKYSLECAICLVEFDEDSMLRLLTVCCHVFHQECIDLWLRSHKTCPVCRMDLDSPTDNNEEELRRSDCDVCIEVKEGDGDDGGGGGDSENSKSVIREQRFVRSHSTGHSIVMIRGGDERKDGDGDDDDDKYKLILAKDVALKVVRGRHGHTKSCSSYKGMEVARPNAAAPCSNCGYVQTTFGSSSRSVIEN